MKQNESEKKLEVGKDYVNLHDNDVVVIDRVSDILNKGFERLIYKNYMSCSDTSNWREATKEEVIEAFKKHLVYRYGKDWETMKIKEKHPSLSSSIGINDGSWAVFISKYRNGWGVWNKNGLLYRNGIWVKRVEDEPTKSTDWTTSPGGIKEMKKRYEVIKTTFSDFKQVSLGDNKTNKIVAHFVEQDEETALLAEKIVDILNLMEK